MKTLTKYLRLEPTTDPAIETYKDSIELVTELKTKKDVVVYSDKQARKPYARFMWYQDKPGKRSKYVTLNSHRWHVVWLEDK